MSRPGHVIQLSALPHGFPTDRHTQAFWESLGRAVATFGFLEDILRKAIFALTATTYYREEEIEAAYSAWLPRLEQSLADPLGNLIDVYGKAIRNNRSANVEKLEDLLADLRSASALRNVICHGCWPPPDANGGAVPSFVNKKREVFQTRIDVPFFQQLQKALCECDHPI